MTKLQLINLIKLLSALESWSLAEKRNLPDYLHEDIANGMELLTNEVLK